MSVYRYRLTTKISIHYIQQKTEEKSCCENDTKSFPTNGLCICGVSVSSICVCFCKYLYLKSTYKEKENNLVPSALLPILCTKHQGYK